MILKPFQFIIKGYVQSFAGLQKDIYMLAMMMFLNRMGTLIFPFLTLYTTQHLHFSMAQAGIATGCFGIGGFAGAYLGGILTDRIGAGSTMRLSLFMATILFFLLQYISVFWLFSLCCFLGSMFADLLRPAVMTCVKQFSTLETQTRALSLMRMAFNLGFAIGPAIAGYLILLFSYQVIFVADAVTCLLAFLFLVLLLKIPRITGNIAASTSYNSSPYRDFPFLQLLLWFCLALIGFFQFMFTLPLYVKGPMQLDAGVVGSLFAINGAVVFILEMPLVHFVEQRFTPFQVITTGGLLIFLGIWMLWAIPMSLVGILLYLILISVGEIIMFPFLSTVALRRSSDHNTGQYMAAVSMLFSLSLVVSPIAGTHLVDHYGYSLLWALMATITLLASIMIWRMRPLFPKEAGSEK